MRYLFCGGGTAGHVSPAIAIAQEALRRDADAKILFVGRAGGEENEAIKRCGFNLREIKISGIERRFSFENVKRCFIAVKALFAAKKIIKDFEPDAVIGTGGYVCWPIIKTAARLGIFTALHESNATPGLVTKLLYKKCNKIFVGFDGAEKEFSKRDNVCAVGIPVNEEFFSLSKEEARKRLGIPKNALLISSFGGSGGSERLNSAICQLMQMHTGKGGGIMHVHSSGRKYYEKIKSEYPQLCTKGSTATVKPYIDDMPAQICASDIVISRCGAITLSEIAAAGVAAILIPSPNVTNNHQYKNAALFKNAGAAILIEESDTLFRDLYDATRRLEVDHARRERLKEKIGKFSSDNAAKRILDEIDTELVK